MTTSIVEKPGLVPTALAIVAGLEGEGPVTSDTILTALDLCRQISDLHRDLKARVEAVAIRHIQERGEIVDGTMRYYIAPNKTTKCLDVKGTVAAVLEVSGGDLDAFVECLSSDAFKPAKTKELLGNKARDLFQTTETADLKTGEVGKKRLQTADSRFV